MDVRFIVAVAGGFALILCAGLAFPPLIRKAYAGAPNQLLISPICLAALGALLLLSAAFEQPVWVVALVLFFVER
jgi:hypothetical protein